MAIFGAEHPRSGSEPSEEASAFGGPTSKPEISAEGRRFEMALLVAGLPAEGREAVAGQLLALVGKRPAWQEEDVGVEAAEQCRGWWRPLTEERLQQQTPRGLLLTLQTELECGLRSAASPLWLLNRIVRRVWLLHQGQRVGQVYRALERTLGERSLALGWVCQMVGGLAYTGIIKDGG
jgi:hypothetical protein